ncbi:MAG TPA: GAF domain-containing sensor histidine kinase [Candidatus Saccharimonadales bacterium]|nr:GAF domain-containing sensor histidine kinase [Candidatus Saccharimonadales bacterium]
MATNQLEPEAFTRGFYNFSVQLLVPLTGQETYPIIGRAAQRLLNAKYSSIFIRSGQGFERVWDSSEKMFRVESDKRGYAARAVFSRTPAVVSAAKLKNLHPKIVDWGIKSVVFIPLFYRSIELGYIALDLFKNIELSKKQKDGLKIFGSMATLAIRKSQLHDQLEESLKTRDLFISLASHELRTPVTTINSYAHLIDKAIRKRKLPERKWMNTLRWELTRLILMFNELFQMDQIKKGQLEYHWKSGSLLEIIKRVVVNFKVKYPKHKIIFKSEVKAGNDLLICDFDKLMQAISNILNNSAKFSKSNSKILMFLEKDDLNLKLTVRDEGIGIPKRELPKIVEGFYKGTQSNREGLGIGLYLTKTIVEIHRGRLRIISGEGKGTTVEVYLPLSHQEKTAR